MFASSEPPARRCPQFTADRAYAEELIAQAITSSSWARNKAWVDKFVAYISKMAAENRTTADMADAIDDTELILAFLGAVAREMPEAKTRVDAAKRALNFVRAVADLPPLDENISVRLLAKSARNRKSSTVKQSPNMPVSFLHCMMEDWGVSDIWWKIQTVLMTFLAFCSLGRGDEVCACLRTGIAWVLQDGSIAHDDNFIPGHHCKNKQCKRANCVRGFMILFPSRKNSQSTPSWIPIASAAAVKLMVQHLEWAKHICPCRLEASTCSYLGRPYAAVGSAYTRYPSTRMPASTLAPTERCCGSASRSRVRSPKCRRINMGPTVRDLELSSCYESTVCRPSYDSRWDNGCRNRWPWAISNCRQVSNLTSYMRSNRHNSN